MAAEDRVVSAVPAKFVRAAAVYQMVLRLAPLTLAKMGVSAPRTLPVYRSAHAQTTMLGITVKHRSLYRTATLTSTA